MGYWRQIMRVRIQKAIQALPPNPSKDEIASAIKNSWPRGCARRNFPYKVWLSEKRYFLILYGINPQPKKTTNPDGVVVGQLRLFDF